MRHVCTYQKQLLYVYVYMYVLFLPAGKRLLVFIDDMNMPQVDTYGTQQPIALLKLLLEKGGMFDRGKDLNWKMFKDVQFIAAMGKVCTFMNSQLNVRVFC